MNYETNLKTRYPIVLMDEIATLVKRPSSIAGMTIVRSLGVKWYGEGAYIYEEKPATSFRAARFEVRENDLIYNDMWARNGSVAIIPKKLDDCVASAHFPTWELDLGRVYPPFLTWYFKTPIFWADCEDKSQGSTGRNAITKTLFRELALPLPSLEEQHRIVAHIEAIAQRIEEAQGLRQGAIEEVEAIFAAQLNIIRINAEKRKVPFRLVDDLTIYCRYGPRFYNQPYTDDGIRIMRATDIDRYGNINYETMPRISVANDEVANLKLKCGDLAIVRSGSIGLMAVHTEKNIDCIPGAYFIHFRFSEDINPHYVRLCFQAPIVMETLQGRGTAMKNINAAKIKELKIPIPELSEQNSIVENMARIQHKIIQLKLLQQHARSELDALLPSILDKAFRGEL